MGMREGMNKSFSKDYKDFLANMDEIYVARATRTLTKANLKDMLVLDEWFIGMLDKVVFDDKTDTEFKLIAIQEMINVMKHRGNVDG
ncbi:hypothetical protein [Clostridium sp.]|uniref:hypothetical protein n=1 Tax=Clostridium sp. TaxID=1506 RepID=UPI0032177B2D